MLRACMEETSFNVTSSIFIPVVDHYLKICLSSSYIPTGSTKTNASGASLITNTDYFFEILCDVFKVVFRRENSMETDMKDKFY